jgi:chemotaxis signal transduction protein
MGSMRAFVPARLETTWILIDAASVREVLGARAWLQIPGARAEMPGVFAWRSRALPILDLAAPFGLPPLQRGQTRARTLICAVPEGTVALPLDIVREVHSFAASELRPCETTTLAYARAEAELLGRIMSVIDLPRFVGEILTGTAPELALPGALIDSEATATLEDRAG